MQRGRGCACVCVGEMEKQSGQVRMGGRLAYVAQQAWIVNDSLQKNVLFGLDLEEQRWERCVHACSLQQDLEVRPAVRDQLCVVTSVASAL